MPPKRKASSLGTPNSTNKKRKSATAAAEVKAFYSDLEPNNENYNYLLNVIAAIANSSDVYDAYIDKTGKKTYETAFSKASDIYIKNIVDSKTASKAANKLNEILVAIGAGLDSPNAVTAREAAKIAGKKKKTTKLLPSI
ncbi:hypothetical protein LTS09_004572 [Friedmanniomyces endolithicus]|nr:hypothetical protein LTS09_004572 [Friedmanniomyces endolithicus]KAK0799331.1 hypothetical protein LTR38_007517 [Friedmanniomyces endolithicus]KAK0983449.1 hypothetical protein LTS01_010999 [Friedmanniomyces endolithicus]